MCAVSGGLDSMCLLDVVLRWAEGRGISVAAAHFNHGLRGKTADRDEAFVREYCAVHQVPFVAGRGDTRAKAKREGLSVEEAARRLRYEFLERAAAERKSVAILTAHHADDNAETMLLNLCRGTGSAGLGIPAVRGKVYRPFLELTRASLEAYAAAHALPHVEDETNQEEFAARNLLRHKVLPVLREINPKAIENMARAAGFLAEEDAALDTLAAQALDRVETAEGGLSLDWTILQNVPEAVRGRVVLGLMERTCGHRRDLSAAHVRAVLELKKGREYSLPYGLLARNNGGALVLFKAPSVPEAVYLAPGETVRFGAWCVALDGEETAERFSYRLNLPGPVEVTCWRSDDRMTLPGSRGSRTLKRLWADAGVPPGVRDGLPVLRLEGRVAAAPYLGVDLDFSTGKTDAQVTFYIEGETI